MKKLMITALAMLPMFSYAQTNKNTEKILKAVENTIASYGNFSVQMDIEGETSQLTVNGQMFRIQSPQTQIWYDGQTMWSYMASSNEVNITNPDDEELRYVNPYLVMKDWNKIFKCDAAGKAAGYTKIKLTPLDAYAYDSLEIYVDESNNIRRISVDYGDSSNYEIVINELKISRPTRPYSRSM